MAVIEAEFKYEPIAFSCGEAVSKAGENQGSAKIFSFAKMAGLPEDATLQLFGRFYREVRQLESDPQNVARCVRLSARPC